MIPPDGPPQAAVIYLHGWFGDGADWARDDLFLAEELIEPLTVKYFRYYVYGPQNSPATYLATNGIPNYSVQWWAYTTNVLASPYTTASNGYAILSSADELLAGTDWIQGKWTAINHPIPSALDVLTANDLDLLCKAGSLAIKIAIPILFFIPGADFATNPCEGLLDEALKFAISVPLWIHNTYNDSGHVEDKAQNLVDMLRRERQPGGRLADYRQINIVSHSQGTVVGRIALDLARRASVEDGEYVANAIYDAPPFCGSSMAQLVKIFYEPAEIQPSAFQDPWLYKALSTTESTAGDSTRNIIDRLLRPTGVDFFSLEPTLPEPVRSALDVLDQIPTSGATNFWFLAATNGVGAAIAPVLNLLRPAVEVYVGHPGFPSHDDLTPAGGLRLLTTYTNSPDVKQFIMLGQGGFDVVLFPTNDLAAVAANPSLLTNTDAVAADQDDNAVADGSARLLTTTDHFGPRMTLLGVYPNFDHDDMIVSRVQQIGTNWLAALLAAPTKLLITGQVQVVDSSRRVFVVDNNAKFSFSSTGFTQAGVRVTGTSHQYRVVYEDGSGAFSPWVSTTNGQSTSFQALVDTLAVSNVPFRLEWRSVNAMGGREMIRTAHLFVAAEAPWIVNDLVFPPSLESYQRSRRPKTGFAIRSSYIQDVVPHGFLEPNDPQCIIDPVFCAEHNQQLIDQRDELVADIVSKPETDWVIRSPSNKVFIGVFDKRGDVEYAWNTNNLLGATKLTNAAFLSVSLTGLTNGVNTLLFRTSKATGGITNRLVGQRTFLVDNGKPYISFFYSSHHALGYVVGPITPLRFSVEDIETDGGAGMLSFPGFTNAPVRQNTTFTLGPMNIRDQVWAQAGDSNIVGGFITLAATATDFVNNVYATNIQLYYDWTAPYMSNLAVAASLPIPGGFRVFTNRAAVSVRVRDPNLSQVSPPVAQVATPGTSEALASDPFAYHQTIGVYAEYTGLVHLAFGRNYVALSCRDAFENTTVLNTLIDVALPETNTAPPEILGLHRTVTNSYTANGGTTNLFPGAVENVAASYYGDTFAFDSIGNGWAGADNNAQYDVFAWRDGEVVLVSCDATGRIARGGASRNPAVSGDGRYVYFSTLATNLYAGTTNQNIFVKDLDSGALSVVTRRPGGGPINFSSPTFPQMCATHNGRYLFFDSTFHASNFVPSFVDNNAGQPGGGRDVFVADLDPDGDGNLIGTNYVFAVISSVPGANQTGSHFSRAPSCSADGRFVCFLTDSTNIHASTGSNGTTLDALAMKFGTNASGGIDFTNRQVVAINASSALGGSTLTALGVEDARVAPDGDTIVFSTSSDVSFSGDTNSQGVGKDVYRSNGESAGGALTFTSRSIVWMSRSHSDGQSSENAAGSPFKALSIAEHRDTTNPAAWKIAWASLHSNMVPNDANGVEDLFIKHTLSFTNNTVATAPLPVNWVATNLPSSQAVTDGGLTPDGRYAYWTTVQGYTAPYTDKLSHLYRRRLDPYVTNTLTIQKVGTGSVTRSPTGTPVNATTFRYRDTEAVTLTPVASQGWFFVSWSGAVSTATAGIGVSLHESATVTAYFAQASPPSIASGGAQASRPKVDGSVGLSLVTAEDTKSAGFQPAIEDADADDTHTFSIVGQASHGAATVENNFMFYMPDANYTGSDSFSFQVTDTYGLMLASPEIVAVTVTPVNDPPSSVTVSHLRAFGPNAGLPRAPDVVDADTGDSFTFGILAQPEHGSVAVVNGSLVYTPDDGFAGIDTFTFRATDSAGASVTGTANVDVRELHAASALSLSAASGGVVRVEWTNPDSNLAYSVEYAVSVDATNWARIPPTNQWPTTSTNWTDTLSPAPQRAFRILLHDLQP